MSDVVVITFDGGIEDFPALIQSVDNQIADGTRRMAVDLHALPFINSAALGYLIKAYKSMEEQGGELALCRLQPAITQILEMTNLDSVFPAFQTVDEAVSYLGGDPTAEGGMRRADWR
ncbi:MAG: STAS domain-containing protein [Planctomycetota bacterium]|nr:STAS domain-containing protein [Planctomycetota bacterium]